MGRSAGVAKVRPRSSSTSSPTYIPEDFRSLVYRKASENPRDLPWRRTRDPYAILVSETMLQQTQAARVIPKFLAWMEKYPDLKSLSRASQSEVLALWSGLGYNRRALALKRACDLLAESGDASVPRDEASLRALPGIGVYTARAVLAFAFDEPTVFLETNIRTVYIKHFFPGEEKVADSLLYPVAELYLDRTAPARWHNALMDYGALLKKSGANHGAKAASYRRQSDFGTSFRRVRGAILREVLKAGRCEISELYRTMPFSLEEVERGAAALAAEGFVRYGEGVVELPDFRSGKP